MDLLALAADLEAIGADVEITDHGIPTLFVNTPALTLVVYDDATMNIATDDGGSVIAVPGIETDIFAVIARHAERMRPALERAA